MEAANKMGHLGHEIGQERQAGTRDQNQDVARCHGDVAVMNNTARAAARHEVGAVPSRGPPVAHLVVQAGEATLQLRASVGRVNLLLHCYVAPVGHFNLLQHLGEGGEGCVVDVVDLDGGQGVGLHVRVRPVLQDPALKLHGLGLGVRLGRGSRRQLNPRLLQRTGWPTKQRNNENENSVGQCTGRRHSTIQRLPPQPGPAPKYCVQARTWDLVS